MASRNKPTMIDIARRAGVSQAAVSYVLNGQAQAKRISPETEQAILDVARELNYVPHAGARAMRMQKTHSICLVNDLTHLSPTAMQINASRSLPAICLRAGKSGYRVLIETTLPGGQDPRQAIDQLRQTLKSDYALLRSRSARALGILGDAGSCPVLRDRLDADPDPAVRIACAAALGELRDTHVASQLMRMIDDQSNPVVRGELALAVAEIAGGEGRFVRLYKKLHLEPGVTAGTVLLDLQKKLHAGRYDKPIEEVFNQAADCFSRDQVPKASRLLGELCIARAGAKADNTLTELLILTGQKLQAAQQHPGPEWIALGLHLLECSCKQ